MSGCIQGDSEVGSQQYVSQGVIRKGGRSSPPRTAAREATYRSEFGKVDPFAKRRSPREVKSGGQEWPNLDVASLTVLLTTYVFAKGSTIRIRPFSGVAEGRCYLGSSHSAHQSVQVCPIFAQIRPRSRLLMSQRPLLGRIWARTGQSCTIRCADFDKTRSRRPLGGPREGSDPGSSILSLADGSSRRASKEGSSRWGRS